MIEDTLEPGPQPDQFASSIAERARAIDGGADPAAWMRGWHDREGIWTNLRNIEHWMARAHR
jgi:hypothetical protein